MPKTFYIIDNDEDTINRLKTMFKSFSDYSCVGISADYDESMDTILKFSPKIVFINIDLNLSNSSIFNFANELYRYKNIIPNFIAISDSKEDAYSVIKNNFFDFLLKPISEFDLRRSLLKFEKNNVITTPTTLCLKSYKDYRFVNTDEILYLKADNNSTDLFMSDGNMIIGYETLKYFENILPDNFIRIHHSYIINTDHVTRIHFGKSKCTISKVHQNIPFSRTYRDNVEFLKDTLAKGSLLTLN